MKYNNIDNKSINVYILLDESVWDYFYTTKIVDVSFDKEKINQIAKDYISKIKKDIDFKNIDKEDYILDSDEDNEFAIYLNGYYNNNHINISIIEKSVILNNENEFNDILEI